MNILAFDTPSVSWAQGTDRIRVEATRGLGCSDTDAILNCSCPHGPLKAHFSDIRHGSRLSATYNKRIVSKALRRKNIIVNVRSSWLLCTSLHMYADCPRSTMIVNPLKTIASIQEPRYRHITVVVYVWQTKWDLNALYYKSRWGMSCINRLIRMSSMAASLLAYIHVSSHDNQRLWLSFTVPLMWGPYVVWDLDLHRLCKPPF